MNDEDRKALAEVRQYVITHLEGEVKWAALFRTMNAEEIKVINQVVQTVCEMLDEGYSSDEVKHYALRNYMEAFRDARR